MQFTVLTEEEIDALHGARMQAVLNQWQEWMNAMRERIYVEGEALAVRYMGAAATDPLLRPHEMVARVCTVLRRRERLVEALRDFGYVERRCGDERRLVYARGDGRRFATIPLSDEASGDIEVDVEGLECPVFNFLYLRSLHLTREASRKGQETRKRRRQGSTAETIDGGEREGCEGP